MPRCYRHVCIPAVCLPHVSIHVHVHACVQALPWWNTAWGSVDLLETREDVEGTGEEEQQALTQDPNTACSPAHPSLHPCAPTLQPRDTQALMDELNEDMEALDSSVDCYVIRDQASLALTVHVPCMPCMHLCMYRACRACIRACTVHAPCMYRACTVHTSVHTSCTHHAHACCVAPPPGRAGAQDQGVGRDEPRVHRGAGREGCGAARGGGGGPRPRRAAAQAAQEAQGGRGGRRRGGRERGRRGRRRAAPAQPVEPH